MSKLTTEEKIQLYEKRQNSETILNLCNEFNIDRSTVKYIVALIKRHGYDILEKKKNIRYSDNFKKEAIDRVVLNGESIKSVAIDLGLSSGTTLRKWIKKCKGVQA